jgi:hypothetical protein
MKTAVALPCENKFSRANPHRAVFSLVQLRTAQSRPRQLEKGETEMRVKSSIKAGALTANHSQTVKGLRVKSSVKGGGSLNHNQTLA